MKEHRHVQRARGPAGEGGAVRRFPQIGLETRKIFRDPTPEWNLAPLICRARDVARTARHARHVTRRGRVTRVRTVACVPSWGPPLRSGMHPQPPIPHSTLLWFPIT